MSKKFLLLFLLIATTAFSQSVEKSIFGAQTGLIGVWVNNEARLSDRFAFRTEIGLDLGFIQKSDKDNITAFIPEINLEPRFYYNFAKRQAKGYSTAHNSANFLSVKAIYNPDWFMISNDHNINVVNQLGVVAEWGIRRVYGQHLSFEAGAGLGPNFYFGKGSDNVYDKQDVYVDLHLRVGYSF